MKNIITFCLVSLTIIAFNFNDSYSQLNPNVKVFRNLEIREFFSSKSLSGIDLFNGVIVNAADPIRDLELADSTGFGRDRYYLRSGDGTIDNYVIGQETKVAPIFNTRNFFSQANFDTITYFDAGHSGQLIPSDFYKHSTYSLGRSFAASDVRVYAFWLKGKKLNYGLPNEVYGILYLKSINTIGAEYKIIVDVKINIIGENDFRETIVGVPTISSEVPSKYSLWQNYPNPFNPSTNIKFAILKPGFVSLKIYDTYGREVESLVNSNQNSGVYNVDWNASQYPSGVYFYKLLISDFSETKKMMLVK